MNAVLLTFAIFFAKVAEVALSSLKCIFLSKGKRWLATLFSFMEILIWAFVASGIITSLKTNLWWLFAYCFGYTAGVYIGSWIDAKMALGTICLNIVINFEDEKAAVELLEREGFSYTLFYGEGRETQSVLVMVVADKRKFIAINPQLESVCAHPVFAWASESLGTYGGTNIKTPLKIFRAGIHK